MKDFIGTDLKIGDMVAYSRNPYSNLYKGIIVGFTRKKIRVGTTLEDITSPTVVFSYQTVKICQEK